MLAPLLLLLLIFIAMVLVSKAIVSGAAGPLSRKYNDRLRQLDGGKAAATAGQLIEIRLGVPKLTAKIEFENILAQVPVNESTGEAETSGPNFTAWSDRAKQALFARAVEALAVYRQVDTQYRETFCKFTQDQASQKCFMDISSKRSNLESELKDIMQWAGSFIPGAQNHIISQAAQFLDQQMQQRMEQLQRREAVATSANSSGPAPAGSASKLTTKKPSPTPTPSTPPPPPVLPTIVRPNSAAKTAPTPTKVEEEDDAPPALAPVAPVKSAEEIKKAEQAAERAAEELLRELGDESTTSSGSKKKKSKR